jgi:hypothetical protein
MHMNPGKCHDFHAHGPHHQNIWPNYIAAKLLENMAQFKYLEQHWYIKIALMRD